MLFFILTVLCVILAAAVVTLAIKIILLRHSADELRQDISDKLYNDTNTLISLSTGDRHMKMLASDLNEQIRALRDERRRLQNGDAELKSAVTNIAHDLRTPLTAISGYLDLLEQEEISPAAGRYLAVIKERTAALKTLTEDMFRYCVIASTSDELHTERVSLNGMLEESIAGFYAALTGRQITPQIELPQAQVYRYLDKAALKRILGNILSNALKYSDGDLKITMSEDGVILFSNTARGLDAVTVGKLFDRFYTVESGRSSTGLGLSIAKILTEKAGGSITAGYKNDILTITLHFAGN